MARRSGLSESAIGRIWRKFELKPHLTDGFKLSTDPLFIEKAAEEILDSLARYLQGISGGEH
jgi:hypothetical protein